MFQVPTFEEIRQAVLRDTLSLDPSADVSADSDHYVHASRLASVAVGQYEHQAWVARQIFPDTADTEYLERHAALRGLTRRNASPADGTARIRGRSGSQVARGLQIKAGDVFYTTTEAVSIARNGTAEVAVRAEEGGVAGNAADKAAQFMAAPSGVESKCTLSATGGTDSEDDASLLARLLELIRRPPAGGNRYDYRRWALSIDGVTDAQVYPLRRGYGTVDIAVISNNGLPSDATLARVQAYIDDMRPVTAKNVLVLKPEITAVPITAAVKLDGISLSQAQSAVTAAVAEYFDNLAPAQDLVVSQLEAVISNVAGIRDRRLTAPAANRSADVREKIEWFKPGKITLTVMP
ncbi:baseplate J/gp47 family protein [Bergeriella denitrificans]|uniref:Baseplate J-like protein n=1 Tax=Bergeriella denitrificans TaxID=494 RepID=A0A378UGC2_BERDE|nr:baseplate J/gp47 family protein [Bergeriella denitrificans]STZ76345.1 baseplate J-like protein [Bergeriella denitrificans]